jgi:GxxExxY protein
MLNPELKLNPKIFDSDVEQKPIRDGYGEALMELGEKNPNVVVLTADLAESTRAHKFAEKWPERFIECGVAEQNMVGIAAGLGVSGKIPFISSYATFSPGKNWETIRTTIIYNEANVKIAGHHSGIVTGPDGATHQATEDIAIMRCLPNIKVISPCDAIEAKKATLYSAEIYGPVYIRFVRDKTPVITTEETPFRFGKIEYFWIPRINADTTQMNADEDNTLLYGDLTYRIRKCIFEVDNKIGKGHKELIYKNALEEEFVKERLDYKREPSIEIKYENKLVGIYRPDFLIEDKIILEIKAKKNLINEDKYQAFSYLRATKYKLLLLVNFGFEKLEIKRIINEKNNYPRQSALNQRSSVVAIFATGHLVYQALLAAKELEEEGIKTYVLNVNTIKPLDIETIFEVASKVKGIVTVEDHQVAGGMGSAISETLINGDLRKRYLTKDFVPPIIFIGLQDTFGESGSMQDLLKKYKMDKSAIKEAVKKII